MALHADLTRDIREAPPGPKVGAFFDVDQTLLAGFSATSFWQERLLSGRMSPREMGEGLLGALSFALGRTGFSGFLATSTAAYRGLAESVLEELGEEVFRKHLARSIYPESRALVETHKSCGHTIAIVSAATRYQVEPLARELGIEHVLCTRLEVERGVFTGRVVHPTCYGEGKAHYAREFAAARGVDLDESFFYTDSGYDLPLLEAVGNPRPLNPDATLAGIAKDRGWPVQRFTSRGRPSLAQVARTALSYASLVPSVAAGLGVTLLNRSRRDGVNLAISTWADLALALGQIDLRVEGEEHLWSQRPAIFLFNHQSNIDPVLVAKLLRRDFTGVGKQEIKRNPIFGPAFAFAGVVFIDRADTAKAIEALKPAVEALQQGRSLAIAPEGTRSRTPHLGPFKKGAFHLAMQAGVPVVPIVFRNALDVLPRGAMILRPATVETVVLPPIDTRAWRRETLDAHVEEVRRRFLEVLEPGHAAPPRRRRRRKPPPAAPAPQHESG
jgi:putative phosphoserine phosphatase/1-acylglycerol-3-phosphate O-acyltransferase